MGGTGDLFRYPRVRWDSDMSTLGHELKKWRPEMWIADGSTILSYIHETAAELGSWMASTTAPRWLAPTSPPRKLAGPAAGERAWPDDDDV